jgi:hypothetical protein
MLLAVGPTHRVLIRVVIMVDYVREGVHPRQSEPVIRKEERFPLALEYRPT